MAGALIRGEYPDDWPAISRETKERAGWRCIRCGHPDGDRFLVGEVVVVACDERCTHPRDGKMRALTVHHLDGDKSNCRWWNLLALCQWCHLSVQARVQVSQVYLWEHSDWFKPYAAGYYAYSILGLETTREVMFDGVGAQQLVFLEAGQPWLAHGRKDSV
jgi:5-methylcytosine-specific restriction endonuclease McrA